MKIKLEPIPLGIIVIGVLFSLYLQFQIPEGTYFSGDAALKSLLAQQLSTGEWRFDLWQPTEAWVRNLWQDGLYPYAPPFVYNVTGRYYITFPFTFPLVTAPFYALFGFRGLYLVPLVATWAIWGTFYLTCKRLKVSVFHTSIALISLIFASHLTLYSAMYWEHSLAVALCFAGMAMLLMLGYPSGLSKPSAVVSGGLIGLSAWFRPEFLSMVATLSAVVIIAALAKSNFLNLFNKFNFKSIHYLAKNKVTFIASMFAAVSLFFVANKLVYGLFLGMHAVEIVEEFSWTRRLAEAWGNFQELSVVGFEYFPIAFFPLLYLLLYGLKRLEAKLNLKIITLGIIGLLIAAAGYLFLTGGAAELKTAIKQYSLPILLAIAWLYVFRKIEVKFNARIGVIYLICVMFTAGACLLLDSGADEIAVGGKQWGPRYLLSLIPLVTWVTIEELNFIKDRSRPLFRYISIFTVVVLLAIGIHKNTYLGTVALQKAHQGVPPATQLLEESPERVIAVSHQYAAQLLEPPLRGKKFFFQAETSNDLVKLSKVLVEQNQDQFIYVCYPYRKCQPPEDSQDNLQFTKGEQRFQIELSNLGQFGKYPIYEASIKQPL
jgi:hypothetical protein